ncbi:hypothetical protein [Specibacter sp. NPDC078692]|uniref:hypothetical protein n=1 Tax=Specibacter sp. NPDC078692 TaxID=3155818 RepID=UPI0034167BA0
MIQLLGTKSLRALQFVQTLNEHGIEPTSADANAFIEARTTNDFDPIAAEYFVSTLTYLLQSRLLKEFDRRLTLSPAGKAILQSEGLADSASKPTPPVEVVGRMTDPLVYAELLTRINDVPDSMVIDPYLHPRDLLTLLQLPTIHRFLTRDHDAGGMNKHDRRQKFRIALGARPDRELRFIANGSKELHDRLVIPQKGGEALLIGTSLGGTQITVVTRLGTGATHALRDHYNTLWDSSSTVEPIQRETGE